MKKIMTLAAMFAAVMVSFSACQKTGDEDNNNGGWEDDEFTSAITIDGDYSDWAALDASKIASATCNADAPLQALKSMKVYADALYIHVYFEYDEEVLDKTWSPVHLYFNSDNDATTGGYGEAYIDTDTDVMLEGVIYDSGSIASYDPGMFLWEAPAGSTGWSGFDGTWDGSVSDETTAWGADIVSGSGLGSGTGGSGKYELSILRSLMSGVVWADQFTIGMDIQANWTNVGSLPNAAPDTENAAGNASKILVTIDK